AIGRRLTRDKESQYKINDQVVRLKDVRDLLMDTGLGVGAYSVMEQGRIDAVLSANPESRRAIFEEAAGISRFKLQKRESLRKLERTEVNLDRAKDLLEERSRRIRSLKIQAGRARRYKEIRDQLCDLRAAVAVLDARDLRTEHQAMLDKTVALEAELEKIEIKSREQSESLTAAETRIHAAESDLEAAQETLRQAQSRRDASQSRRDSQRQRADELRQDGEEAAMRSSNLLRQQDERRDLLSTARERLAELEAELIELHKELEGRRAVTKAAQGAVQELQEEREGMRDAVLEWIHARTRCRNLVHDQEAQLRSLQARAERLLRQDGELDGKEAEGRRDREKLQASLRSLADEIERFQREEREAVAGLEAIDQQAAELARRESSLREDLAAVASRREMLLGLESQLEGLDQGPKYLLENKPDGLRGRLLDLLAIDLQHGRALEAALGPFLQALVVDTRAHAEAMLAQLHAAKAGRALLLVEEEFAAQRSAASPLGLPPGAVFLLPRVECSEEARALLSWLLRGVCLVDDLSQATANRPDLCFVTLEGDLLCGPRFEGGEGGSEAGLLLRRSLITQLEGEEQELRIALDSLRSEMRSTADQAHMAREQARNIAEALQEERQNEHRRLAEVEQLDALQEHLAQQREALGQELSEVRQHRYQALASLGTHLFNEVLLRRLESREASREQEVAQRLDSARAEAEAARQKEQELRIRQASCSTDRGAQVHKIESHEQMLRDFERAANDLGERQRKAVQGAEAAEAEATRCAQELLDLQSELKDLEAARDRASEELASQREDKNQIQTALQTAEAERGALNQSLNELRLRQVDNEHRFERLEERLFEDSGLELRRCLGEIDGLGLFHCELQGPPAADLVVSLEGPPQPPAMLRAALGLQRLWEDEDFEPEEARKEIDVLKSQADRLGSVNLGAVEELEAEEDNFLGTERDVADLTEARRSLMEALRQMEVESRALFEQTFQQARGYFKEIFRKLFQGGRADMYLHDDEDSLESGIEIVAKPPGKELQSIALLSGGERSLTALAILFAVFKVKPSPFCILDEVDAALDDTNVERFLRVLQDFVGPSQFCIVTHHKRTMAECKTLYGVTMQRRGISTRIAVSLDEVDEIGENEGVKATDQRIAGEENIGF
ncbi:MAG: coiled-coil domain-containing protein, partial [Planctomycetota bacterium]